MEAGWERTVTYYGLTILQWFSPDLHLDTPVDGLIHLEVGGAFTSVGTV